MRQLLMLGFYCKVYRRDPLCRIYINDILVDEFNIPHTPKIKNINNENKAVLDPYYFDKETFEFESSPLFCKFIEFNDQHEKNLDIRVEIHNDDNNYSNGFMTKNTQIIFSYCYLLSTKVLKLLNRIKYQWKFNKNSCFKKYDLKKILNFYTGKKAEIVNNLVNGADLIFPDSIQHRTATSKSWIGTSGYFHLKLKKKLGFWRHNTDNRKGIWRAGLIDIAGYLCDKYKQYEDQRSSNT